MKGLWEKARDERLRLKYKEMKSKYVCTNNEVKRRREGVVPLILNVGTRWWWSASHPDHLTPGQRASTNDDKSGC
jgi:hypothetical protein